MFLKTLIQKINFVAGYFNLNCLDYNKNFEIWTFYNRIFAQGCIPLITKPTSVTSKTVSLVDIFTKNLFWHFIETQKWNY